MKNIYKLLSVVAVLGVSAALSSCNNEDFLATQPYDIVDSSAMFESDANAKMGMVGVYDLMQPDEAGVGYDGDWGLKPNLFTGCHPTMDTQCTGWDVKWLSQAWDPTSTELLDGWKHAYGSISRANEFLSGLQAAVESDDCKLSDKVATHLEGEARCVRAFFYHWLATTFGRVPMLGTGENYTTHPQKARAETYSEMWDFIIEDLTIAASLLDWEPMDGEYGRATKGMALAYLGDAYMWKAYRLTDGANGKGTDASLANTCLTEAAKCFKDILDNGPYELSRSFTTNWDPASAWNKETIWVEMIDEGSNWSGWSNFTSKFNLKWYVACPDCGGWGSLALSWEWWSCYEVGDKRREGSACIGPVDNLLTEHPDWYVESVYGVNPYIGETCDTDRLHNYHYENGGYAPSVWSTKLWRTASAYSFAWNKGNWSPTPIYWKRLANIYLDYAECLFRLNGEGDTTAWKLINELRDRAFGNLEVGHEKELTDKFLPYYQSVHKFYAESGNNPGKWYVDLDEYPIPFNTEKVEVRDAEDYYTALKAEKGFSSPVWKIAINEERRKEFNCEWCLRPDMQRSGYLADHIEHNYPKQSIEDLTNIPWANRDFEYNELKMDMPIPADEIIKNPLCDQNDAY